MKKRIITLLLICGVSSLACADELQLLEGRPDRYVVVKGDTLWAISGRFLKDPWRWPQIWKMNREQIKNPHWIYPGDVVVLDTSGDQPELRLLRETVTLEPGAIEESLQKTAIPPISPSVIGPFLSQPLVVEEKQLEGAPEIVAAPDGRLMVGAGYRAYVSSISEGDGANWNIYRPGEPLVDPETQQKLGYEAIYLGDAKIEKYGEPATVNVTRSKQEITIKDKLVAAPERLMSGFVPHAPDTDISGRVMSSYGGMAEIGRNTIITLNRGNADGVEEGHVLAVYGSGGMVKPSKEAIAAAKAKRENKPRDYVNLERGDDGSVKRDENGKVIVRVGSSADEELPKAIKLPDERIGLVMVFRTFEHVAYALVMQAERPIHVNDVVKTP